MTGGMLWGGRFGAAPDEGMLELTRSIDVDIALLPYDLAVTRAHARALVAAGLLDADELGPLDAECDRIRTQVEAGDLVPGPLDEDVHSLVERCLTEALGETGARIHAGRSRNDLVATDLRLWCRDAAGSLASELAGLIDVLVTKADAHRDTLMPGYTHLQRAQPVTVAFHLLAHGFALARDLKRFADAAAVADVSSLGAGALAGTTLPIDPDIAARELGFGAVFDNAMDAVADRDFVCDLLYATAMTAVHVSRLAEEVVLWTSTEFSFARLADEWSTGSSMMPQKRNPDMAELARGRSAGCIGDLNAMLVLLKGLPLAYDRDLQEEKSIVFAAVARLRSSLMGMRGVVAALNFDAEALEGALDAGGMWATDLAEILVARGVPFRTAHEVAGRAVATLEEQGRAVRDAGAELAALHDRLEPGDAAVADPVRSVAARSNHGGPAPVRTAQQIAELKARIAPYLV